jgi:CRP-like cAMP-binding protein
MVGATLLPPAIFRVPRYRSAHRRTFAVLWDLVRRARHNAPVPAAPGIVDTLLASRDSSGAPLTDDEAVTYLAYGTLGACAYVSRLTAFMLYEILRNAALTEELRAESRQAFEQGVREASDLRRMRLMQSVYHETLRRHPISPGMPYVVDRDFDYAGARFRKGEATVLSPVPLSFSPDWFPEPERFDPARCREPRNEHRGGHCHPFGLGNRTCVAGGLVEVMAVTLVATLLHERALTLDPPDYRLSLTVRPLPAPSRRFGVRVGGVLQWPTADLPPLTPSEEERLAVFAGHDDPAVVAALARAEARRFPPGAAIVREGELSDAYYLLRAGEATVLRGDPPTRIAALAPGDGFGEVGLLQNAPRNATVVAGTAGADTLVLDRDAFLAMVASSDFVAEEIRALMRKRLASNRLRLVATELTAEAVARALPDFTWASYEAGAVVIREGDVAEHFFVVVEGEVEVSRRGPNGVDRPVTTLGPGEYFGEVGLLRHAPRNARVAAGSGGPVAVLRTDRPGFDRLLNQTGGAGMELSRAMLACAERLEGR